ncbi:MAG: prepilin-type cleavage/methylation domain-containing protein [Vulcanococcus sp.]
MSRIQRSKTAAGFSLLELLLALSLGLLLSGVMLQGLIDEGQNGQRLARLLRERAVQRRTLALVKADLAQATAISPTPQLEQHGCSLAGRLPVLHLSTAAGAITYAVGPAPSAIWRGRVLMRCGPAYGLDGRLSVGGAPQNRVVIDGLAEGSMGFQAEPNGEIGGLEVRLEQTFVGGHRVQRIVSEQPLELPLASADG